MKPVVYPRIVQAYIDACELDVLACKPGNVADSAPGHDMEALQFRTSARVSALALAEPGLRLGERIHEAVLLTQAAVACNTNLGIVLLCAPMAQAGLSGGPGDLRAALSRVLAETTIDDADQVYRAIRCAAPGGLGTRSEHDVAAAPTVDLRAAMTHAATHDRIARQYATDFEDLWITAVPYLEVARSRWGGDETLTTSDLYLHLLARFSDTHIERKHGVTVAERVRKAARVLHSRFLCATHQEQARHCLQPLDAELKAASINPGTTADLVVASHFLTRLCAIRVDSAGASSRSTPPDAQHGYGTLASQTSYVDKRLGINN